MVTARLQHETAFIASTAVLEVVSLCLPVEKHNVILGEFYHIVRNAIECYEIVKSRQALRLPPSVN